MTRIPALFLFTAASLALAGCKTAQDSADTGERTVTAGPMEAIDPATGSSSTGGTTGGTTTGGTGGSGGTGSIPALVNVSLQNVLNDLSVAISVDRANIPVNAQVPIEVAANVCGVSVSALAASIASGQAGCTATTTSPQLTQAVQQQVAAGGDVQGGDQTMGTPTNNVV